MAIFSSILQMYSFSIFITITIAKTPCLDHQKALLLELKMQLVVYPPDSPKLVRWNQTPDCCQWGGVECDSVGRVVGLHLDNSAILGGIEASSSPLFRLRHLQELNLAFNWFETPIPKGIGRLASLTHLNLSYAGFVGQIPHEVSLLTRLVVLDLSTNMLYLTLEHPNLKMLVQNMHRLRELCLDGVNISAGAGDGGSEWSQALSSLPHLRILSLSYCGISGPFHPSLSKLHSLSILRLDGNDFFTKIPDLFLNFTRLTSLSCVGCSLRGPLPKLIFEMPSLRELDLSSNELLEGTIPELNLSSRGTRVNSISMRDCGFGGVIPSMISNLTELVNLDLSLNFLTGSIPSFHMLEKVKSIDLGYNALNGSLSYSTFEGLTSLAYLGLHYNSLRGSIPHSLFALPSLEKLFLEYNRFSGELMIDYFPTVNFTTSLEIIQLSNNFLSGSIPQFLFTLPSLELLMLSNNQFNGKINHLSINSSTMGWLDLSSNLLQGPIPDSFFQLRNLTNLILSNNRFTTLPTSVLSVEATLLIVLDLSNNIISGEIPSWIWEMGASEVNLSCNLFEDLQRPYPVSTQLLSLDLHSNHLRGELPLLTKTAYHVDYSNNNFDSPVPHSFFDNNTSSHILVANNSLSGSIPTSLCNATSLEVVDLSFNRLSDSIPSCLVFEQIKVISLKGNNLNGLIPHRFTVNCSLQTFDLSSNNLGGKIPNSISNCKELAVFNVGGNNFDDTFPCMLSSSLQVLVLRSNRFHGELRCHKSWPKLQIIDISSNDFNGSLLFINLLRGMMRRSDGSNLRPNYSSFDFLSVDGSYQDEVTLTVKGQVEVKIVKIWPDFTCIDFSRNNFHGEIPVSIGNLSALYLLNLSHNALSGTIPRSLGNLTELGSLDFSFNKLRGSIPDEIGRLTFLSVLNLSYNHLIGKIPSGNQLQTFAADSFIGNEGLHGFPLDKSCSNVNGNGSKPQKVLTYEEIEWEYVSVAVGYVVGFGSIVWMLLFWRRFRKRYFEKIDQVAETILEGREGRRREARRRVLVRRYEVRRHRRIN